MDDGCLPEIRHAVALDRIKDTYYEILGACIGIIIMTLWRSFYSTYLIDPFARAYARRKSKKLRVPRPTWLSFQSPSSTTASSHRNTDTVKKWKEIVVFSRRTKKNGFKTESTKMTSDEKMTSKSVTNGKIVFDERDMDALIKKLDLTKDDIDQALQYLQYKRKHTDLRMKYAEQLWKVVTQGAMMIFGTYFLMFKAPYFWDTRLFWTEFPQKMSFDTRVLYHLQLAYHGHRAVYQAYEHVKPDWLAYVIHHWITMILILMSWSIGFTKLGAVVMVLHDYSDVFLALAKFTKYIGYRSVSKYSFYCFVWGWFHCRMYWLVEKIIYSIAVEAVPKFGCREPYRYTFLVLLTGLFCLHCYWGWLILKVAYRDFNTGLVDDVRSDISDDDEDDDGEDEELSESQFIDRLLW